MPARFFFDHDLGLSVVEFSGTITGSELEQIDRLVISSPLVMDRTLDLTDLRRVTETRITSADIDASVRRWAGLYDTTKMQKLAFVARRDLNFGQSKMFAALAPDRPYETKVFRGMNGAEDWFGIPHGTVDRLVSGEPVGSVHD